MESVSNSPARCPVCGAVAGGVGLSITPAQLDEIVFKAVRRAEEVGTGHTGEQKHAYAVGIINALVDIPFVPESAEERLFWLMVDGAIKLACRFKAAWTSN